MLFNRRKDPGEQRRQRSDGEIDVQEGVDGHEHTFEREAS
jgi:hypothetical protein